MIIGIMSYAHDSVQGVKDALRIFSARKVDLILSAGGMIGSGNCYAFQDLGVPIKLVYGNNDMDRAGLARESSRHGGECLEDIGETWDNLTRISNLATKRMKAKKFH